MVQVLPHPADDVLWLSLLVPLDGLEGKDLESLSDVLDGSLLCVLVFQVDSASFSILVVGEHVDAALGKLDEQHTWVPFLVDEVLQFRLVHVN